MKKIIQKSQTTVTGSLHILRRKDVEKMTGFKRSYIYKLMQEGRFPKAVKIGIRAVGWNSDDIEQWINKNLNKPTL